MPPQAPARRHVALAAGTESPRPVGTTQIHLFPEARRSPDALEAQSEEVDELSLIDHNEIMGEADTQAEVGLSEHACSVLAQRERVRVWRRGTWK